MIRGRATGSPVSVTLRNAHREYYKEAGAYSQFERVSNTLNENQPIGINSTSHIRLNTIINNANTRQLALTFYPNATDGVDRGIDAMSPDRDLTNDVYFFLDNEKYVIEGVNFNVEKRIPLGVNVSGNSTFKFSIVQVVNFDESQEVYLFDALDGSYHNLRQGDYEVSLPTGIYNNRFEITFKNEALSIANPINQNIFVVQNNSSQQLVISNPTMMEIKSVTLYDITGKLLFNKTKLDVKDNYEFSTASLSDAVYLVKVQSIDGQSFSKKIIISSK
jgi:hypothetical protein